MDRFSTFLAHFLPKNTKIYQTELFRGKKFQRNGKKWFRSFIGNFGPQTPPKTTPGQNRPLKWVQVAKNGRNALHGTQLTGLRPKKTFLSRSSKNLQFWHGATQNQKDLNEVELKLAI